MYVDMSTGELLSHVPAMGWRRTNAQPQKQKLDLNQPIEYKITQQGQLLQVKVMRRAIWERKSFGGSRGEVTGFSKGSRKRMIDTLARIDKKKIRWGKYPPKFWTLTYKENVTSYGRAKRDLKVFVERMQERFPEFACVWKMEQQKRGAIHFHLMVFGVPFYPIQDKDGVTGLQQHWSQVNGEIGVNNSFDQEIIRSINGVMFYVAKYMTKDVTEDDTELSEMCVSDDKRTPYSQAYQAHGCHLPTMGSSMTHIFSQLKVSTGRWWGVYGRGNMPYGDMREICGVSALKTMSEWKDYLNNEYARLTVSFTLYGEQSADWYDKHIELWKKREKVNKAAWRSFRDKRWFAMRAAFAISHNETVRYGKIPGVLQRIQDGEFGVHMSFPKEFMVEIPDVTNPEQPKTKQEKSWGRWQSAVVKTQHIDKS